MRLKLKRRHYFYSVVFTTPLLTTYIFSGAVFLVPVDSGEKVSFAITMLLAQTVSCATITSFLPASSLHIPRIAFLLTMTVIQISVNAFLTILGEIINLNFLPLFFIFRVLVLVFDSSCLLLKIRLCKKNMTRI